MLLHALMMGSDYLFVFCESILVGDIFSIFFSKCLKTLYFIQDNELKFRGKEIRLFNA